MEQITNFKLKEFYKQPIELIEDYVNILKNLEPQQTKNQVIHLKLKDVEFIKQNLTSENDGDLISIISMVQGIKNSEVLHLDVIQVFSLINSIKEQIQKINRAELSSLSVDNTNIKWESVNGSERIAKFGIYNTIDNLAKGDILKWNAIFELPYSDVFMKLLMDKTNNDLQKEMEQIKSINN
ncbi:hypothetical protein BA195_10190 [Tenacibaculum soleae]|uniref:Uncharacterized protein n=1 Tax=Tenacibaculum soleae TaxID=447689 RepID=A0A1B9XYF6_9FLAO|nr:hypothetical protein [Tenacibaculum soleae]OCK42536.1 hypothetical protein BA195_10190 [Tenacibaculum soleae]